MKVWTNEEVAWAGKTCLCFEQVDSTNEEAKRQAEKGTGHGTLIWAKSQSSGKGRRGREWYSPAGSSIYMTLLLKPDIPAEKASMFTLVAALAVSKGILRACGLETFIKWPNDIVAGGKKLCGILTELVLSEGHISCLVIGMGINVFQESFPEKLQQKATSVYLAG